MGGSAPLGCCVFVPTSPRPIPVPPLEMGHETEAAWGAGSSSVPLLSHQQSTLRRSPSSESFLGSESSRGVEDIPGTAEESWAHSWVFLWQRGSSGHPEGKEESQGIFGSKGSSGHPLCIPRAVRVLQTSPGGRRHIASLPTKPHGMRSVIWGVGRHH